MATGADVTARIKADDHELQAFSPTVFEYVLALPAGTAEVPDVRLHDYRHMVDILPASHPNGRTVLIVRSRLDPTKSVRCNVRFVTAEQGQHLDRSRFLASARPRVTAVAACECSHGVP
jgi:hypothetical protein